MPLDNPRLTQQEPLSTVVVRARRLPMADLQSFYDRAHHQLRQTMAAHEISPTGPSLAYYLSAPTSTVDLEVGFPVAQIPADFADGEVQAGQLPGGPVAQATHVGGYEGLGESWGALSNWVAEQGRMSGAMWEVYVTEPSPETDPAMLRTDLFVQLLD